MATIRTETELLADFADGQGAGVLTPSDMRNLIQSLRSNQGNGWAHYADNARKLEVNALAVAADTRTALPNDGAAAETDVSQIELLGANIWNTTTNRIMPALQGDAYDTRITFKVKKALATTGHVDIDIDIGGAIGIFIGDQRELTKGVGVEQRMMFPIPLFVGTTFLANGGGINLTSELAIDVWDIRFFIVRTFTPTT